jgi:hypothetical protein
VGSVASAHLFACLPMHALARMRVLSCARAWHLCARACYACACALCAALVCACVQVFLWLHTCCVRVYASACGVEMCACFEFCARVKLRACMAPMCAPTMHVRVPYVQLAIVRGCRCSSAGIPAVCACACACSVKALCASRSASARVCEWGLLHVRACLHVCLCMHLHACVC